MSEIQVFLTYEFLQNDLLKKNLNKAIVSMTQ